MAYQWTMSRVSFKTPRRRQPPAGSRVLRRIVVRPSPGDPRRGILLAGGTTLRCALGRAGIAHAKREGDGATPAGGMALLGLRFRPDRVHRPATALPAVPLRPGDGWCDAPDDRNYNRPVPHPYLASHEALWRDDGLYDLVIVLGWNARPRVKGRGSAVFLHLAGPGYAPTAGCIALARRDLLRLLPRLGPQTVLVVA
jgi:L,D-peptidoglycan transpeptidase YkuD (ErfK/YbiS/YcfS/YnhG family)